jgi:hypothetical protein
VQLPEIIDELGIAGPGQDALMVRREAAGDFRIFETGREASRSTPGRALLVLRERAGIALRVQAGRGAVPRLRDTVDRACEARRKARLPGAGNRRDAERRQLAAEIRVAGDALAGHH